MQQEVMESKIHEKKVYTKKPLKSEAAELYPMFTK